MTEESQVHRYGFLAGVSLVIILLDQASKAYIMNTMHLHQSISIIPDFFSLTYIRAPISIAA